MWLSFTHQRCNHPYIHDLWAIAWHVCVFCVWQGIWQRRLILLFILRALNFENEFPQSKIISCIQISFHRKNIYCRNQTFGYKIYTSTVLKGKGQHLIKLIFSRFIVKRIENILYVLKVSLQSPCTVGGQKLDGEMDIMTMCFPYLFMLGKP